MYWIGSQHGKYNLKKEQWHTIDLVPDEYYHKYWGPKKEHCTAFYRRILKDETICGTPNISWAKERTK